MKVLYFSNHSEMTGANLSLIALIEELKSMGSEAYVVLPNKGPFENVLIEHGIKYSIIRTFQRVCDSKKIKKINVMVKNSIKMLSNKLFEKQAYELMRDYRPDIVHINTISSDLGFRSAKRLQIPVVWHIREMVEEDHGYKMIAESRAYKELSMADIVIAISDSVSNKFSAIIGSSNIIRIYNGVDTKYYYDAGHRPFSGSGIKITIAGRIKESKGFEEAIDAFSIICRESNHEENLLLQIVGECYDKKYFDGLQSRIDKLGLSDKVRFLGFQKDMASVWRETDIAFVCSRAEAFGRVTVEAILCGAFVIGADTMGTKEIIRDGYNGFLYKQGNAKSLAERSIEIIGNKERAKKISGIGIDDAKKRFTAKRNADDILAVYSSLLR